MPPKASQDESGGFSMNLNTAPNKENSANYSIVLDGTSIAVSPEGSSPTYTGPPRPKRRKVRLACRTCRRRKTRCDGTLPVCQACISRRVGSTCVYVNVADDPPSDNDTHNEKRQVRAAPSAISRATVVPQQYASRDGDLHSESPINRPRSGTIGTARDSVSTHVDRENNFAMGADALATVTSNAVEDGLVYRGSSTIAFLRSFTHGTSELTRHPDPNTANGDGDHVQTDQSMPTRSLPIMERDPSAFLLPPRWSADEYVQCFWEFVHPLFPVLHKTSFMEKYSRLWTSEGREPGGDISDVNENIFISTLNLVFAIGCQFSASVPAQNKVSHAEDFYQRSRKVFVYDIFDSTSVSLVQMLLVSGVYLQSTRYASRCWNVVGLAIRTAQSLGLHIDVTKYRPENQLNKEMARRIWHTCFVLDKLLAMTFGRPTMITNNWDVPMPSLIDDEHLRTVGEGQQPPGVPSRIGLLVSSSHLFVILDEILASLYSENLRNNLNELLQDDHRVQEMILGVLVLNRRLESFVETVPEYIRDCLSTNRVPREQITSVQIQEQVLFCRFQYTRVLLLRPILLLATKRRITIDPVSLKPASLDVELVRSCCNLCVRTAQTLIECLHHHLNTTYRSSGWHTVYFAFAAASIILVGLTCPIVDEDLIRPSFEINWHRALGIMDHYKQQIQSAPRAIQTLKNLRAQTIGSLPNEPPVNVPASEYQEPAVVQEDWSHFNPFGTDFIDDTWFSQHITNMDWLELC